MADNTVINAGLGGDSIATDDLAFLNGGAVGSAVKAQRVKVGYGVDGSFTDVSGATPMPIVGGTLVVGTGAITTATTVVSAVTATAGNVTITISGTHAGINVTFEASDDSGTTWFPIGAVREDSGIAESSSGVLPANTARMWTTGAPGYTNVRVRATAFTSGSGTVRISQGTMPFETQVAAVMQAPTKTLFGAETLEAGTALTTTSALMSLIPQRSGTAAGAATSIAITAGKTLRIQAISFFVTNAATAAIIRGTMNLRYNPTGATTAASTSVAQLSSGSNVTTAQASGASAELTFADGLDLAGGTAGTFGVSVIGNAAGGLSWVSITGYEF